MSTIGGPGGIGGPKGPNATDETDLSQDVAEVGASSTSQATDAAAITHARGAAELDGLDAVVADLAAGRLTPREAIDRLVEATAGPDLGTTERAELRELLGDLIANDPHLGHLAGRV